MSKHRDEVHTFTKEHILKLCEMAAIRDIVGDMFVGVIGKPVSTFLADGSVEVRTHVNEEPLPRAQTEPQMFGRKR